MTKKTVKVRGRTGTATMDITIPAAVSRKHGIEQGDVFAIESETDDQERLVLKYTRVYDGK